MESEDLEWDDAKASATLAKRGVSFEAIRDFDWKTCWTFEDTRPFEYHEARWISLGLIGDRLHVAVWTTRGKRIRLISLRKASPDEIDEYEEMMKP